MVDIISRAQWGARPWQKGAPYLVGDEERTEFFVHYHGAAVRVQTGSSVPRTVEAIHLANGWSGVGYNFMVDMDGVAYEGRGWGRVGAHSPRHNRQGWGCYVAVGADQKPTEAALQTVRALYDEGCERTGRDLAKKGHRDARATACPGDVLYPWVVAGMFVQGSGFAPLAIGDGSDDDRPILAAGTRGRHVEVLQEALSNVGYSIIIDGFFGVGTEAFVRAFQKLHGLKPDGIVGPATYAVLSLNLKKETPEMFLCKDPRSPAQYLLAGNTRKRIASWPDYLRYAEKVEVLDLSAEELDSYPEVKA